MGRRFTLELFFYLFLWVFEVPAQDLIGSGLRCYSESGHRCCTNYQLIEGSCKPCIGTFGENCSGGPCSKGYYGFGCLSRCNCSTQQQCDRIKGCTDSIGRTCPDGFYGLGCSSLCFCSLHQQCDGIKGCVDKNTLFSDTKTFMDIPHYHSYVRMMPILLGIIFGGGTVLLTAVVYLLKSIKSNQATTYVEDIFLPREYDQPQCCNIQESNFTGHNKQNVKFSDHYEDPHTYVECV